jgi:hypothetical protein
MKFTFNITTAIIIVIAVIMAFSVGKCSLRDDLDMATVALKNEREIVSKSQITIDSITRYTYTQHLAIVNNNKAINYLQDERERLKALRIKDVNVIGNLQAEIAVLNKKLSTPNDPVFIEVPGAIDSVKYLKLPQKYTFKDKDGWAIADIKYPESFLSFGIDSLSLHITIGEQGQGFLKKKKSVVVIDTPNKYVAINQSDVILVQPEKTLLQRPSLWVAVGLLTGLLIR